MVRHGKGLMSKSPCQPRRKICVMLDREQMELVEKLSAFLAEDEGGGNTGGLIESAVKVFTEERVRYVAKRYHIDVRSSTLTEMRQLKRDSSVGIVARDTVVLPVGDNAENRAMILTKNCWPVPGLAPEKLAGLRYVAIYWRGPTHAVTHYASLMGAEPAAVGALIRFGQPEPMPEPLSPRDPEHHIHRPRFTTLSLLLQAKVLEEAF